MIATASVAAAEDKVKARQLYSEGSKHYYLNEYAEALDAFKRAYWNYEEPTFLYNIAQCYRALGKKGDAIEFYRSYLRRSPEARNRDEVLHTIAELEAAVAEERASTPPVAVEHAAPTAPATHAGEGARASAPAQPSSPALQLAGSARATKADRPAWKKRWVWGVVAGAVVVAAGVAIGIGVGASAHDPAPSLGNVKVN